MARTHEEIMAALPAERRAKIEARTAEVLAEVEGLKALRKIAGKTQKAVADKLEITQPGVHQIEQQADVYISTFARYVEGLGGTVEFRVTLPETGAVVLTGLGDLKPPKPPVVKAAKRRSKAA